MRKTELLITRLFFKRNKLILVLYFQDTVWSLILLKIKSFPITTRVVPVSMKNLVHRFFIRQRTINVCSVQKAVIPF